MIEAGKKLQEKQQKNQAKDDAESVKKYSSSLYNDNNSAFIGSGNGKIDIVEFFDYNCGYCRVVAPHVIKLTTENKNIRVINKEVAILSPSSEVSARASIAVHHIAPEKYTQFYSELLHYNGDKGEKAVRDVAAKLGLDGDKIMTESKKEKYLNILVSHHELADKLRITGTPAFIINNKIYRGAMRYEDLKKAVEEEYKQQAKD